MSVISEKYPIGIFVKPEVITQELLDQWIDNLANFPFRIKAVVLDLSKDQLDTPYREGGWTVRQVVHHCADSHMNSFIRFKLALTEESPVIKPYYENRWAELPDSRLFSIDSSLCILEGVHIRWVALLRNLSKDDLKRSYIHPDNNRAITLDEGIGLYDWHCRHHLAHITVLRDKMGWF